MINYTFSSLVFYTKPDLCNPLFANSVYTATIKLPDKVNQTKKEQIATQLWAGFQAASEEQFWNQYEKLLQGYDVTVDEKIPENIPVKKQATPAATSTPQPTQYYSSDGISALGLIVFVPLLIWLFNLCLLYTSPSPRD